MIYSSSLDRGLGKLLDIWPRIKEQVPDAELIITYSRWYDLGIGNAGGGNLYRRTIERKLDQPGVRRIAGGLSQPAVAALLKESLVWAHPSWYETDNRGNGVPFLETSCIAAMEAQAAGCTVVCSDWGALTETVKEGLHIPGPMGEAWEDSFVQELVFALTDEEVQNYSKIAGPKAMSDMSWDGPAEQVANWLAE